MTEARLVPRLGRILCLVPVAFLLVGVLTSIQGALPEREFLEHLAWWVWTWGVAVAAVSLLVAAGLPGRRKGMLWLGGAGLTLQIATIVAFLVIVSRIEVEGLEAVAAPYVVIDTSLRLGVAFMTGGNLPEPWVVTVMVFQAGG